MLIKRRIILILNKFESCAVLINSDFDLLHYYNNHKQIMKKGSAHFSANIMLLAISSTTTVKNKANRRSLRTNCWRLKSKSLQTSNQVQFWKVKIFHSGFKSRKSIVCIKKPSPLQSNSHRFDTKNIDPNLPVCILDSLKSHAPKFNFQNCSFWKYFCS